MHAHLNIVSDRAHPLWTWQRSLLEEKYTNCSEKKPPNPSQHDRERATESTDLTDPMLMARNHRAHPLFTHFKRHLKMPSSQFQILKTYMQYWSLPSRLNWGRQFIAGRTQREPFTRRLHKVSCSTITKDINLFINFKRD